MKRLMLAVPVLVAGLMTAGCAGGYSYGYVGMAPPPPRAEYYGYAPGPGYVWTSGYWGWTGGRYNWVPGRWQRPPRPHDRWVGGRWENTRHGYRYHDGYWRH